MLHWAMQNALGTVTQLSRPREEAFLGGQGLENLGAKLLSGP